MPPRPVAAFRPRTAWVTALLWGLVTVGWLALAARDGGVALARQLPFAAFAGVLVWAVMVRPSVAVDATGVRLRNVVRDVHVPWPALESVGTRFALTLHTADGRSYASWAAPASGRYPDPRITRSELAALALDEPDEAVVASASPAATSGAVAAWIRREWRRATPADGEPTAVTVRLDRLVVGLLAVTGLACLVVLLT